MAGKVEVCFYCDPNHQGRKDLMIEAEQILIPVVSSAFYLLSYRLVRERRITYTGR